MQLSAGIFLQATAALQQTIFADAVLYLSECNSNGAIGFVINKPYGRSLHELSEFRSAGYFPLYEGGPVDAEHLFFLHQRPDLISGGSSAGHELYFGGQFADAVSAIRSGAITSSDIKVFVGYCGWDPGDLEAEIAEGSWTLFSGNSLQVFAE